MATKPPDPFLVFDDLMAQGDFLQAAAALTEATLNEAALAQAPPPETTIGWGTDHPATTPGIWATVDEIMASTAYKTPIKKAAKYQGLYGGGMKKKSNEPPIELNLAAKPPSKFIKLTTLEEYHAALKEGKHMAFLDVGSVDLDEYRQMLEPNIEYHDDSIKELMSKNGLWVHREEKVMLYGPALLFNKQVGIVTARNMYDWVHAEVRDHLVNRPYYVRVKSGWTL